jgi:AraC-like DNA-binding protein
MNNTETLRAFYENRFPPEAVSRIMAEKQKHGHFNVYRRNEYSCKLPAGRRDFYKISLIIGTGKLHYADKGIEVNSPALMLSNPNVPYAWEPISEQSGYFCLFTEDFITHTKTNKALSESPLFKLHATRVFFLDEPQVTFISKIFERMLMEMESEYIYKYDLLLNYVEVAIHEALKLQPATSYFKHINASSRIASLFVELLERQFPIDSVVQSLKVRTAHDFADRLSIHVNHLNRAVKEVTGKTTTEHIAERVVKEARALLSHTDWNISEIAYCLGFEYPAYFNNFFKKQTGMTPGELR